VRNDVEAVVAKSADCALDALVKSRQAVLSHIIEHDRRGLTFRANRYAALSPDSTIRSVREVGGAVDVRVGEGGLQEESVLFIEDGVGVGEGDGRSVEFQGFNNGAGEVHIVEGGGIVVVGIENADRGNGRVTLVECNEMVITGVSGGEIPIVYQVERCLDGGSVCRVGQVGVTSAGRLCKELEVVSESDGGGNGGISGVLGDSCSMPGWNGVVRISVDGNVHACEGGSDGGERTRDLELVGDGILNLTHEGHGLRNVVFIDVHEVLVRVECDFVGLNVVRNT